MKHYNHITLIGNTNTGKSSFVKRLLGNNLLNNYDDQHMIEFIEFSQYDDVSRNTFITYFYDIPGYNGSMAFHYLEKTECVMIFCDYSKLDTLESAIDWLNFINKNILCYLVVTKIDLEEDGGFNEEFNEFNELLEKNCDRFKEIFKLSLKNTQLNKISLQDIMLLINNDILNNRN